MKTVTFTFSAIANIMTLQLNDRVTANVAVDVDRSNPDPTVGYRGECHLRDAYVAELTVGDVTLPRKWLVNRGFAGPLDELVFDRLVDSDVIREYAHV